MLKYSHLHTYKSNWWRSVSFETWWHLGFIVFICLVHSSLQSFTLHIHNFLNIIWSKGIWIFSRILSWPFKGTPYVIIWMEVYFWFHSLQNGIIVKAHHSLKLLSCKFWVISGRHNSLIRDKCQKQSADGWPAMSVGEMILTIIAHLCQ